MNHRPHNSARAQEQGFTLVVIAALFIAFAVVASVAIERNSTVQQITRRDATAAQLSRLANAILEYSTFNNNRFPCPALLGTPVDLGTGSADFGAEIAGCEGGVDVNNPGTTIDTTSSLIPILDTTNNGNPSGETILRGMVPVLALSPYGIAPADALDPWNNRIIYVVNRNLTKDGTGAQNTTITVADRRTGYTLVNPDFILMSYGRDGVGGHKVGTNSNTVPSITCSDNSTALPYENCDNDVAFFVAPTYTAPNAGTGDYFDDILTWYRQ